MSRIALVAGFAARIVSLVTLSSTHCLAASPSNDPARYAWETLAQNSSPVSVTDHRAKWERWRSSGYLFGKPEIKHNCAPDDEGKELVQSVEFTILSGLRAPPAEGFELRFNSFVCQSVLGQGLFSVTGRMKAFKVGKDIVFPDGSIALKGKWIKGNCDAKRFHCGVDKSGSPLRLIALHLAIKHPLTPSWFWATWEHESVIQTPGYAEVGMCCNDGFGFRSQVPTPALKDLLRQNGLGGEWQHYRLVGTQTEFEEHGAPTYLGNTEIEAGFARASSCITCHARATTDSFGAPMDIFRCDLKCAPTGTGGASDKCQPTSCLPSYRGSDKCNPNACLTSYNGRIEPSWYLDSDKRVKYIKTGFIWSLSDGSLSVLYPLRKPAK